MAASTAMRNPVRLSPRAARVRILRARIARIIRSRGLLRRAMPVLLVGAIVSCSGDSPVALHADSANLFWAVRLDIPAATIAVGGTQQLVATPVSPSGAPLEGLPMPAFRSSDETKVTVSPDGVLTAVAVTPGTTVIASLTVDGLTNVDTTTVVVTPTSAVVQSFSLDGAAPYTVVRGSAKLITPSIMDDHGQALLGLAVKYVSLDTIIASIQQQPGSVYLTGKAPGKVRVAASMTGYGVTKVDTIEYTVTNPTSLFITCIGMVRFPGQQPFLPTGPYFLKTNGTVSFSNGMAISNSITFDDVPGAPDDITLGLPGTPTVRQFTTAGAYRFTDAYGNTGLVVVQD
jgi:hypothetical protein